MCCYEDLRNLNNIFYINYKNFIFNPYKTTKPFLKKIGLKPSNKTLEILKKVKPPKSINKLKSDKIKNTIDPEILKKLEKYTF